MLKLQERPDLAAFQDLDFLRAQIDHGTASRIGHPHVEADQVHSRPKDRGLRGVVLLLGRQRDSGRRQPHETGTHVRGF